MAACLEIIDMRTTKYRPYGANATLSEQYYAKIFPTKLTFHMLPGAVARIMAEFGPDGLGQFIVDISGDERIAFVKEVCRRWNHSAKREDALLEIRHMADRRRTSIRMPNDMLLATYIGQALLDEVSK
jgi:hypothetical protein